MSMYTIAQLLAANEQKFKFDPLFLRLFFRESYPFTTGESLSLTNSGTGKHGACTFRRLFPVRLSAPVAAPPLNLRRDMSNPSMK